MYGRNTIVPRLKGRLLEHGDPEASIPHAVPRRPRCPAPASDVPNPGEKRQGSQGREQEFWTRIQKDPAAGRERGSVSPDSLRQDPFVGQKPAIPGSVQ